LSITTFSELKTAVQNWLHRSDTNLTNRIPEFIALCEAKFNRTLRLTTMETRVSATLDERYEDLPSDFLEMRTIEITGDSGGQLEYMTPGDLRNRYRASGTGVPKYFTIIGTTIEFAPAPAGSYTMEMVYYKAIPALSDSNTTNWMLTNNPDAYLYGSLLEAAPFMKKPEEVPLWATMYKGVMKDIADADERGNYGGPLMMRVG